MSVAIFHPPERIFLFDGQALHALLPCLDSGFRRRSTVLDAIGPIAGFNDMAMMRQSIQQYRFHLGITKHIGSLPKGQIGGDHQAGMLVEL